MAGKQEANDGPAQKKLPPQVEKMLASAKEMEAVLSQKLALIDSVSMEKSEMAKQEAMKIKADVEEIKRLSLLQTKEGDEALRAKIMEVNKRIETTTRKAAELQKTLVTYHKELYDEASAKGAEVKKAINSITVLPEPERARLAAAVDATLNQAREKLQDMKDAQEKLKRAQEAMKNAKPDQNMSKEDVMKKLEEQLTTILAPQASQEEVSDEPNSFKASPRTKKPDAH